MLRLEQRPFSDLAEVNPTTRLGKLTSSDLVSFIPMPDVTDNGRWKYQQSRPLQDVRTGYTRFQDGDVLFAKITPCMENGKGAHVVGLVNGLGYGSTEFHVLRSKPEGDARFIFHWTQALQLRLAAEVQMTGSAGQKRVPTSFFNSFQIPALPLPEQRRIAEILDTLDRTIEATQRIIGKLQATRQGLLHDLLTRGLDEHGQLRDPQRHPEQFKDTALGRVPVGWELLTVAEAAAPNPGSSTIGPFGSNLTATDYRESGTPVVFVRDIKEDGFVWKSEVYLDPIKAKSLQAHAVHFDDVVITKMGDPPCLSCVYPDWMAAGIITADVIRVTVDTSRLSPIWLSLYINSPQIARQVRWISGGVTRSKVTLKDFRSILVAVPSPGEQARILCHVERSMGQIRAEQAQLAKLQTLKRGLMEDLLTGRVRVAGAEVGA